MKTRAAVVLVALLLLACSKITQATESQSVNIGTFHAYGGWSPAYEFGRWPAPVTSFGSQPA